MWGNTYHRDTFINAFKHDTLHTSYCFFGDGGVGKTTTAREIASYIETGTFEPTTMVDTCIFTPNEKGSLGIEEVRNIKEFCSSAPLRAKRKIAIIQSGDAITNHAQSALLKLVEEPPEHSLIIIIVKNKDILFPPLLSRLHTLYFPRYSRKQIVDFLVEIKKVNGNIAEQIALRSLGSLGRAIKHLEKKDEEIAKENTLEYLEQRIEYFYTKGLIQYSGLLKKLLKKESELHEFILNGPLQKRSIQYFESEV